MGRFGRVLAVAAGTALSGCAGSDDTGAGKTEGLLSAGDTIGLAAPDGAILLDASAWVNERDKRALGWSVEDGMLVVAPGSGNLRTRERFGDCRIHVEFNVTADPAKEWKNDGNSGVYIQRRYELQILNSHGQRPSDESCGAIYTTRKPDTNASKIAGEWQTFDVIFRAPRWDGEDKIENARLTVFHNGVLIHDDVPVPGKTGAGKPEGASEEPLRLQDHGSEVRFRNVWIERLELE